MFLILELLEGLKRAQRSRLEDQRGTEINFELPDFLKDKEKYQNLTSVGNKLRKTRFNESPSNSVSLYNNVDNDTNNNDVLKSPTSSGSHIFQRPPQPAPRLSIVGKSPTKPTPDTSVQSKISNLENTIMMNTSPPAVKYLTQTSQTSQTSRSNTPIDTLNLSTQCMASQTPVKRNSGSSPIYNPHPIYYSPDTGIYAGNFF